MTLLNNRNTCWVGYKTSSEHTRTEMTVGSLVNNFVRNLNFLINMRLANMELICLLKLKCFYTVINTITNRTARGHFKNTNYSFVYNTWLQFKVHIQVHACSVTFRLCSFSHLHKWRYYFIFEWV